MTVSAAISLTDALEEVGKAFQNASGAEVRFNFAGSNVLARQIIDGAPADVFVSADEAQMRLAESAGAIASETKVDLLGNRLAVVVAREITSIAEVKDLLRPEVKRIAIADPEAVPAGVYARQYLRTAGLWDQLSPKVVPVANVRAALTSAENGSVAGCARLRVGRGGGALRQARARHLRPAVRRASSIPLPRPRRLGMPRRRGSSSRSCAAGWRAICSASTSSSRSPSDRNDDARALAGHEPYGRRGTRRDGAHARSRPVDRLAAGAVA